MSEFKMLRVNSPLSYGKRLYIFKLSDKNEKNNIIL